MTVRELIEALSRLDPNLPVMIPRWSCDHYCLAGEAFEDLAMPDPLNVGCLLLCDERDAGGIRVARLFEQDQHLDG